MPGAIHFFDVDHTITSGSTGRRFAEAAARRGILKLRHLAIIPVNYLLYRLGGGGTSIFEGEFPILRGIERRELEEIAEEVFARRIRSTIRPELIRLIESLKAEGDIIVLATSSLDFIVEPLARTLGADKLIASGLEFENDRCTGRLERTMFGAKKRDEAKAFALERGVELADCSFYSDSIHDLPLLLEVGRPVAVDPDRRLAREAKKRGWRILRTSKSIRWFT
jgi:HAD superfamily hydrolase (TIGR01490 family)